ncbi:hypothetical protein [Micromonospora sp. ATA51]|uniref:hypothetical protein n=1 Tax=Micromonospora sp. ATA51 TaxID=2806098 RepID=UPI001A62DFF8|nr:hypothetical protein [Micromonospora sp. ATA51]MBM0224745.1 hypothetical protein [Micromonospora sp. ATA51]
MTTAEAPATVSDQGEDELSRDLADLHVRAQHVAAELADLHARLAVLQEEVRRHQQRR